MIFAFISLCTCRYEVHDIEQLAEYANTGKLNEIRKYIQKRNREQKRSPEDIPFEISQGNVKAVDPKTYNNVVEAMKGQDCMVFCPVPAHSISFRITPLDSKVDLDDITIVDYNGVEITDEERKCGIDHECSCKTIRRDEDNNVVVTYDTPVVCMPKFKLVRQ